MKNEDIRCQGCARLLFKIEEGALNGALSIKCTRCKSFNHLRPQQSPAPKRHERDGKVAKCGSLPPRQT
ncbi:MAG: Com family DNA-binding transcriptional regulator [Rhodobacteraceae bacterium]|nr:Com family DNA-binding transcriptional regulator [Paracoccaceae bacterium]